jgi:hypothetical protein
MSRFCYDTGNIVNAQNFQCQRYFFFHSNPYLQYLDVGITVGKVRTLTSDKHSEAPHMRWPNAWRLIQTVKKPLIVINAERAYTLRWLSVVFTVPYIKCG